MEAKTKKDKSFGAKLPVQLLKPVFLREIPRSGFMPGPKLKAKDEKSRQSFISRLRKGPDKSKGLSPSSPNSSNGAYTNTHPALTLNCAVWMSFSKPIDQMVSLLLHYKDQKEEYCLLVDEANPNGESRILLSGSVTLYPNSQIKFIKTCCSGVGHETHIYIDDMHVERVIDAVDDRSMIETA